MISFDDAMAILQREIAPLGEEVVDLASAAGRYISKDVVARIPSPRVTASAMDGYAVRLAEVEPGRAMTVVGEARPGQPFGVPIGPQEVVRIFTGAPLPDGTDCVIMQEYASRDGVNVTFAEGFGPARHIREAGGDFEAGDVLLGRGARLAPRALIAAAGADIAQANVYRQPRVALLATGDELADPGSAAAQPYLIPDSIGPGLAALATRAGAEVVSRTRSNDDLPGMTELAGDLLASADLVVVTGGASVGEHDFSKPMFAAHGLDLLIEKVAIKPGKPVWLGRAGKTLVLGLPGNPTSAMVTARLFLEPVLELLQGGPGRHAWRKMPLSGELPRTGARETFTRASWERDGPRPLTNQDSGAQGGLVHADWLVRCPPGQDALPVGTMVDAIQF